VRARHQRVGSVALVRRGALREDAHPEEGGVALRQLHLQRAALVVQALRLRLWRAAAVGHRHPRCGRGSGGRRELRRRGLRAREQLREGGRLRRRRTRAGSARRDERRGGGHVHSVARQRGRGALHLWNNELHYEGRSHCEKLIVNNEPLLAHYQNNELGSLYLKPQ